MLLRENHQYRNGVSATWTLQTYNRRDAVAQQWCKSCGRRLNDDNESGFCEYTEACCRLREKFLRDQKRIGRGKRPLHANCHSSGLMFQVQDSSSPPTQLGDEDKQELMARIDALNDKQKYVIVAWYLLGLTQAQIGRELGLGRERVRQILARSERTLRHE